MSSHWTLRWGEFGARVRHGQGVGAVFVRGAGGAFIAKSLGLATGFGLQVLLARVLGVEGYGIYVYALTWVSILLYVSMLGFDTALVRFLAQYHATRQWGHARGVLRRAGQITLLSGMVLGLGIATAAILLDARLSAEQSRVFLWAAVLMPVCTLSNLRQAALRAMKRVVLAELPDTLIRPSIIALVIGGWFWFAGSMPSPSDAMAIQVAASLMAFLIGGAWLVSALPRETRRAMPVHETRVWLAMALPMVLVASTHMVLNQTDVALLGIYSGTTQAGIYAAMVRLSDIVVFGLTAANAIAAPMISEHYHAGRHFELQHTVRLAAYASFAFALLASVGLVLFSGLIIGFFGDEFFAGRTALFILLAGQLVGALTGPVGYLMSMTGHHNRMAMIQGIAAASNLVLNVVLIPRYGMEGAALATTMTMILWNVWMLMYVRRRLGVRSTIF